MWFLRYWLRELRTPALRVMMLGLILAIASVSAVGVFSERLQKALSNDARQLLGGDLVVVSDIEITPEWRNKAAALGLQAIETKSFPSMAVANDAFQLVALKAVEEGYPLRGALRIAAQRGEVDKAIKGVPERGQVWADEAALASLSADAGSTVSLGDKTFLIRYVIVVEPDRGAAFSNFAPRILMNSADLPATRLVQPSSRITYRLLLAGSNTAVAQYERWLKPQLKMGQRIDTIESGRPEIRSTLDRAEKFLSLAALLGTLVASVGVALIAHHYAGQKAYDAALLKSLGFSPKVLQRLYLFGLLIISVIASSIGAAIGWAAHWGLVAILSSLLGVTLPMAGLKSMVLAIAAGCILMAGFAGAPVVAALSTPPIRVLRQDLRLSGAAPVLSLLMALSAAVLLCLFASGDVKLTAMIIGGLVVTVVLFALVTWLTIRTGLRFYSALDQRFSEAMRGGGGVSLRFAWVSLSRRIKTTVIQGVALTLGLTALLLLSVVKADLIEGWQKALPENAPNRFALNIQPDQKTAFSTQLSQLGVEQPDLYPMVRGRLVQINERVVDANYFTDDRAKRLVDREFNLSYSDTLPLHNRISGGRWFSINQATALPEISIEEGIAKTMAVQLGDALTFDVAGQTIRGRITSFRSLEWDSMKVNFFVIMPTNALKDFPQSWITAFHLPQKSIAESRALIKAFPNVTMVDTGLIVRQIRSILGQVAQAVQFIFMFTVAGGAMVLVATIMSGTRERTREAAIMRALGASRIQLQRALWLELALVGFLAGLLAALTSQLLGWAVARYVFDFSFAWSLVTVMGSTALGVFVSMLAGGWSVNTITKAPPLLILRELG